LPRNSGAELKNSGTKQQGRWQKNFQGGRGINERKDRKIAKNTEK